MTEKPARRSPWAWLTTEAPLSDPPTRWQRWTNTKYLALQPAMLLKKCPSGPFRFQRFDTGVTVAGPSGRTLHVHANPFLQQLELAPAFFHGVDVSADGHVIARLFQYEYGLLRHKRVLHVQPAGIAGIPSSTIIRRRRGAAIACEAPSNFLIRPTGFLRHTLTIAPGVPEDLVLLYVAVKSGFPVML